MEYKLRSPMPAAAGRLYAWHASPGALDRLVPPWQGVRIEQRSAGIDPGSTVVLNVPFVGPLRKRWVARHTAQVPGVEFQDVQISGPFAAWTHTHRFEDAPCGSILQDHVAYELPLGGLGRTLGGRKVAKMLDQTFAYRHAITNHDLAIHARRGDKPKWRILVTGGTGMVGSQLVAFLMAGGHQVTTVTRKPKPGDQAQVGWDQLDAAVEQHDAVIHLAGETVNGRWTKAKKELIRSSRVDGTRKVAQALARAQHKPGTFLCASATGFYGPRGDEVLTEDSASGEGFLAEVCRAWEAECEPARQAGIRVVNLRLGVVLSPNDGALKQMLTPFKLGLGGPIGSGKQWMGWIALDDVLGAVHCCLDDEGLRGPVNLVAPNPVTNAEFTRTLASVLSRPAFLPMPGFAARLAFGEMADELLLTSQRVLPKRLQDAGFSFFLPSLDAALRHMLGVQSPAPVAAAS